MQIISLLWNIKAHFLKKKKNNNLIEFLSTELLESCNSKNFHKQWKRGVKSIQKQRRAWPNCMGEQDDPDLLCTQTAQCLFSHAQLIAFVPTTDGFIEKEDFSGYHSYLRLCITETSLFKYTENFTTKKWKFSDKNSDFFFLFLLKT